MIRKISLTACLFGAVAGYAQTTTSLAGFSYGDVAAPTGKEWESPQELALNSPTMLNLLSRIIESIQETDE